MNAHRPRSILRAKLFTACASTEYSKISGNFRTVRGVTHFKSITQSLDLKNRQFHRLLTVLAIAYENVIASRSVSLLFAPFVSL